MMDDYIRRSDALNFEWSVECEPSELQSIMTGMAHVMDYIKHLPAADVVEVVHGSWIEDKYGFIHCSRCLMEWDEPEEPGTNYRPACGAKMDGGDHNAAD